MLRGTSRECCNQHSSRLAPLVCFDVLRENTQRGESCWHSHLERGILQAVHGSGLSSNLQVEDRRMVDQWLLGRAGTDTVIRIVGRATLRESPALRSAAEVALDAGPLVWDLAECEYLDSTMLGCLIGVRKLAEQRGRRMDIAANPLQQVKLFSTSALHKYFEFLDQSPKVEGNWLSIEPDQLNTEDLSRHVLVCHERLAERGGEEGEVFRRVCDRLSTEIEQHEMDKAMAASERSQAKLAQAPRRVDDNRA